MWLRAKVNMLEKTLTEHLVNCERKGARLEKLAWWALAIGIAVLGVLLKDKFFHIGG